MREDKSAAAACYPLISVWRGENLRFVLEDTALRRVEPPAEQKRRRVPAL